MPSNKLHKRCPRCKRIRTFTVPPDGMFSAGREWQKRDNEWVCAWCVARETPDGEEMLRTELSRLRDFRKAWRRAKKKGTPWHIFLNQQRDNGSVSSRP